MVKKHNNKGKRANFKKILAWVALTTFLVPQVAYASSRSQQKEKAPISIILGAGKGLGSNKSYGGELGLKYKRFALVGNMGSRSDINLQNIEEKMISIPEINIYFQGREDLEDFSSIGASLEYHQPLAKGISWVTGIGGKRRSYTRKVEENLVRRMDREESLLASNINSIPEKEFVWNVYAGPSFELTNWLEVSPILGYEKAFTKNGLKKGEMYASLRAILSFPGKGKK